jgi:peptidoglycan/LPS O-acetylase OafA/YrhL
MMPGLRQCTTGVRNRMTTDTLDRAPSTPLPLPAEPHPADPSAPRHFDFVDSLRGLAIVGVMMVHVTFCVPDLHGRVRALGAQGQYGVQLFFIVSAFTLFWSLRSRRSQERRPLLAFFTRRFFRLAPLFWTGVAFYVLFPLANRGDSAPAGVRWPHVLATLAFVHSWYPSTINSVVPGGWSIGAEAMFYLCIPVLFARVRTLNGAVWLAVLTTWITGAAAGPVERRLDRHFPHSWGPLLHDFVFYSFPSQLPVFCLGIVLYFLLAEPRGRDGALRVGGAALVVAAALALFGAMGKQIVPSVAFVALAVGLARRPLVALVNPVTRFIGMVSFSGYIWHFWVLEHLARKANVKLLQDHRLHLRPSGQYIVMVLATLVCTLPIATVSYYAIEVPGQSLGKWVINRFGWGRSASPG